MLNTTSISRPLACALAACGFLALASGANAAGPNLVQNGSFETGSFASWTEIGNNAFDGVQCPGAASVTSGICDAYFGPIGATGGIQQAIATSAGSQYLVTFDFLGDPGNTSSFRVDFGATTLLNVVNPFNTRFQSYSFTAIAGSASDLLKFQFRDDLNFMELDNVSVTAVPEPSTWLSLAAGLAVVGSLRRRRQQAAA